MQIGTGLQNKLLEAMSMGIPCVTSSLANRSLKAVNGENIYVRDSLADYVEIITSQNLMNESKTPKNGK